jgi:hypothetical protein
MRAWFYNPFPICEPRIIEVVQLGIAEHLSINVNLQAQEGCVCHVHLTDGGFVVFPLANSYLPEHPLYASESYVSRTKANSPTFPLSVFQAKYEYYTILLEYFSFTQSALFNPFTVSTTTAATVQVWAMEEVPPPLKQMSRGSLTLFFQSIGRSKAWQPRKDTKQR